QSQYCRDANRPNRDGDLLSRGRVCLSVTLVELLHQGGRRFGQILERLGGLGRHLSRQASQRHFFGALFRTFPCLLHHPPVQSIKVICTNRLDFQWCWLCEFCELLVFTQRRAQRGCTLAHLIE